MSGLEKNNETIKDADGLAGRDDIMGKMRGWIFSSSMMAAHFGDLKQVSECPPFACFIPFAFHL
jgi:hypothetical protein